MTEMEEDDDGIELIDSENYRSSGKKGTTTEEITMHHLNRILQLSSKEMRGGFYNEKVVLVNGVPTKTRVYIEDGRQAYSNAVEAFYALIAYQVLQTTGSLEFMKSCTDIKKQVEESKIAYLKSIEDDAIDVQKAKRYDYVSEKLSLSKKLFFELMQVLSKMKANDGSSWTDRD